MDSKDIGILAALGLVWWYVTKNPTSSGAPFLYPNPNTTGQGNLPKSAGGGSGGGSIGGGGGGGTPPSGTGPNIPGNIPGSFYNDTSDPCDPNSAMYAPDTPVTNTPVTGAVDSMDPCDPSSSMYDPSQCGGGSGVSFDSGDPCDPSSSAFDPSACSVG